MKMWKSPKEHPEPYEPVLCCKFYDPKVPSYFIGCWYETDDWEGWIDEEMGFEMDVDLWMPIPDPVKI